MHKYFFFTDQLKEEKDEMALQIQLLDKDNESLNKEQRRLYDEVNEYKKQVESLQNDLDCLLVEHVSLYYFH